MLSAAEVLVSKVRVRIKGGWRFDATSPDSICNGVDSFEKEVVQTMTGTEV